MSLRNALALSAVFGLAVFSAPVQATTYDLSFTGEVGAFNVSQFPTYTSYSLDLTANPGTLPVSVSLGDTINSTVTFDMAYQIPSAPLYTNILQYFFGDFSPGDTQVSGTFKFFDGATLVASFGYGSSTSSQLASYAAVFAPNNPAFTFDSFTNAFTIDKLDNPKSPTTINASNFTYQLVSPAVPEASTWAMMILGFAGVAFMASRRKPALMAA